MDGGSYDWYCSDVHGITFAGAVDCSDCATGKFAGTTGARPSTSANLKMMPARYSEPSQRFLPWVSPASWGSSELLRYDATIKHFSLPFLLSVSLFWFSLFYAWYKMLLSVLLYVTDQALEYLRSPLGSICYLGCVHCLCRVIRMRFLPSWKACCGNR